MKNREAFSLVQARLDPWLKGQGFGPARDPHHRGIWGWSRPDGPMRTNLWYQGDKYPFDPFSGSSFVIEFETGREAVPGPADFLKDRARLNHLLDDDERERLRALQNVMIAKLRMPTAEQYRAVMGFPPLVPLASTRKFAPIAASYRPEEDVWLRYFDRDDLTSWAEFLADRIPGLLARFLARA